jgi:hypothetical protein
MGSRSQRLVACLLLSVMLAACGVATTGSGGLGAVSSGVVELIIEGAIVLVAVVVLWKVAKIIMAAISK